MRPAETFVLLPVLALLLLLAACGGGAVGAGGAGRDCRDGEVLPCACADGSTGTTECGSDSCACEPAATPNPVELDREGAPPAGPGPVGQPPRFPTPAGPGCLSIEPGTLAFALDVAGCGTDQGTVTVTNGCEAPVMLERIVLDGDGFLGLAEPPLPAALSPGGTISIVAGYRPTAPGSHRAELVFEFVGLPSRSVSLVGTAGEGAFVTDHFAEAPRAKADLLVVIDNGTSMAALTPLLETNLRPFLSFLQARELDFHVGVTTTGLAAGGDCPGGVGGGEDGRLFPVVGELPRFITPDTPDAEGRWVELLRVGACREGPNDVFEAALRAVSPPLADGADDPRHPEDADGNAGFLRPEAHLSVLVITNRDDTSPGSPASYHEALQATKGVRNPHLFNFHAITGDPETGCSRAGTGAAEPGDRLVALVEQTDGGLFQAICAPDWESGLRESGSWLGFPQSYPLTARPADLNGNGVILDTEGEIEVSLNGTPTPSRGQQGQPIWAYAIEPENAVRFNPLAVPEPGTVIDVRYRAGCP